MPVRAHDKVGRLPLFSHLQVQVVYIEGRKKGANAALDQPVVAEAMTDRPVVAIRLCRARRCRLTIPYVRSQVVDFGSEHLSVVAHGEDGRPPLFLHPQV